MSEEKKVIPRLGKAAREFNVATKTIVEFLFEKGFTVEDNINTKLTSDMYELLTIKYQPDKNIKEEAQRLDMGASIKSTPPQKSEPKEVKKEEIKKEAKKETIKEEKIIVPEIEPKKEEPQQVEIEKEIIVEEQIVEPVIEEEKEPLVSKPKIVGKVDLDSLNTKTKPAKKSKEEKEKEKEALKKEKEEAKKQEKEAKKAKTSKKSEQKSEEITSSESEHETTKEEIIQEIEPIVEVVETPQEIILPEKQEVVVPKKEPEMIKTEIPELKAPTVIGKVDLASLNTKTKPKKKSKEELRKEKDERIKAERASRDAHRQEIAKAKQEQQSQQEAKVEKPDNFIKTKVEKLSGPKVVGKMEINSPRKDDKPKEESDNKKVKRKRIKTFSDEDKKPERTDNQKDFHNKKKDFRKERRVEISGEDVDLQIKKTMARMAPTGKTKASKHRREKRDLISQGREQAQERQAQEKNILKVTEFITVNDLANMMDVPVAKIIGTCMSIGLVVAINQRLDAENIALLAEEYGFKIQFVGVEDEEDQQEEVSNPENLVPRAPIVTVMGHVDHGKTSLLDYIRKANVIAGEAGGITQHIGAYEVELPDKRKITFLDTPGHEAFTAMRARGAKITDIAIIVIAADDSIMPQTVEAINHAQAAGVPMIFAINKIDKQGADPDKIRTALANMNLLVEEWGGKIQSQDISAKKGINVDVLLEKVLIEAEMLELKADPTLHAMGTVIESSLDKGRGYIAKMLIQNGTLRKSDIVVAGTSYGKIKAMYNERNQLIPSAGPSAPVLLLGLDSAPQAGDTFKVFTDEREAKSIVSKRQQLIREQGLRTQKHITLTEIGRRIAVGDFKELNIIVKGDVDGSIEALSDSLLRLTTEDVEVRVIHKSVGQVTESDVLLASASNAIIVAFQVRPSAGARKLAEQEQIDIRTYSVIYDAINEIKDAIEGMRAPEIKENIVCNIEVRETFRITKVGTIAGCYVLDGKVQRNTRIRVIRDGIVIYTGRLGSLKRFKDDVKEVSAGYECGLNIESFNDIKVGDIIEGFEEVEVKRT
jgi:translation initiation factor IF-2